MLGFRPIESFCLFFKLQEIVLGLHAQDYGLVDQSPSFLPLRRIKAKLTDLCFVVRVGLSNFMS